MSERAALTHACPICGDVHLPISALLPSEPDAERVECAYCGKEGHAAMSCHAEPTEERVDG